MNPLPHLAFELRKHFLAGHDTEALSRRYRMPERTVHFLLTKAREQARNLPASHLERDDQIAPSLRKVLKA